MPGWFQKAASRRDASHHDQGEESVRESAEEFRRGLEDHLKARAELLGLELREAGDLAARKGLLGLLVAALAFFAYALLLVAAVSLLGRWLAGTWPNTFGEVGWQLVAIALGVLHVLLALVVFRHLRRKPAQPLFEYTLAEFQKDREWLQKSPSSKGNDASP